MSGVNQQKNRELKRAAPDLFKKSRSDQQSSTNEIIDDVTGKEESGEQKRNYPAGIQC